MSKFVDMTFQIGISPLPPPSVFLFVFGTVNKEKIICPHYVVKSHFLSNFISFSICFIVRQTKMCRACNRQTKNVTSHTLFVIKRFFLFTFSYLEFSALIENDVSRAHRSANPKPISCPE